MKPVKCKKKWLGIWRKCRIFVALVQEKDIQDYWIFEWSISRKINDNDMNTISIEILNPKAGKLLENLADLNLIAIKNKPENGFTRVLKKMRSKATAAPTLEEITKEVEIVRTKRYEKNNH